MIYMTAGVEMNTTSSVSAGFKRFLMGQNVFITSDYTYSGAEGTRSGVAI